MNEYTLDGKPSRRLEAVLMVQDSDKWLMDEETDSPSADEPTTTRRLVSILSYRWRAATTTELAGVVSTSVASRAG